MNELKDLVEISRHMGMRFDLFQAGGGNSSVKMGEFMLIKASGIALSDMDSKSGFVKVDNKKIKATLENPSSFNDFNAQDFVVGARSARPSMECLMHSLLYKYTLHSHPLAVNIICARADYKSALKEIFGGVDYLCVDYKTPGLALALEIKRGLETRSEIPKIIFLQNHGLIISSPNKDEIYTLTNMVCEKIENYLKLDLKKYRAVNEISALFEGDDIIYLSQDSYIKECLKKHKGLFFAPIFCPDMAVYLGLCALELKDINDKNSIKQFIKKYAHAPKVILLDGEVYLRATSLKKAREMEEVLRFALMVLKENLKQSTTHLSKEALAELLNLDAEKYRQEVK